MSAAVWPPISHEKLIEEEEDALVSYHVSNSPDEHSDRFIESRIEMAARSFTGRPRRSKKWSARMCYPARAGGARHHSCNIVAAV